MGYVTFIFGLLAYTGELERLVKHLIDNGLHSEPTAFGITGILALLVIPMLQFQRAYEGCRETLAVRRYQRSGALPY